MKDRRHREAPLPPSVSRWYMPANLKQKKPTRCNLDAQSSTDRKYAKRRKTPIHQSFQPPSTKPSIVKLTPTPLKPETFILSPNLIGIKCLLDIMQRFLVPIRIHQLLVPRESLLFFEDEGLAAGLRFGVVVVRAEACSNTVLVSVAESSILSWKVGNGRLNAYRDRLLLLEGYTYIKDVLDDKMEMRIGAR